MVVALKVREDDQARTSLTLFMCFAWTVKMEIYAALFLFSNVQYIFYFHVTREDSRMKPNDVSLPQLINVALLAGQSANVRAMILYASIQDWLPQSIYASHEQGF